MSNLFGEENQERLNELRKRSKPMFHEWLDSIPSWIKRKGVPDVDKLEEEYIQFTKWVEEKTSSGEEYAESYLQVFVYFYPVFTLPFLNTIQYWAKTHLRRRIITKNDIDVSAPDIVDSDSLFVLLKKLEPVVRVTGYKNIGLHSVLQKRIESAIIDDNLSLFEEILYDKSSETELLCHYFGKLSNCLSNEDELKAIVDDKQRLQSTNLFEEVRVYLRSIRHLPEETKNKHIAVFIYGQMRDLVMRYYGVREEMTPGEKEIFEGLINNPVFPVFAEYCHELEIEWLEKNQGEEQESEVLAKTVDSETQAQISAKEMDLDKEKPWTSSDYQWPDRSFFVKDEHFVKASNSITLIGEIADFAESDEKYERFKKFMEKVAVIGKIANVPDMEALIQFFTGRKMENAAEIITWSGANHGARYLVYIVQKVAKGKNKYDVLKFKSLVCFTDISGDDEVAIQDNPKNIAGIVQGFKNMDPDVLLPLTGEDSYECFSELNKFKTKTAD